MWAARIELKKAEKVRKYLAKQQLFDSLYEPIKELGRIYFPLVKRAKVPGAKVVQVTFSKKDVAKSKEDYLKRKLTKRQLGLIPKAQEIVGKVMVLEIPQELKKKEKVIAEAYLKATKNVETVLAKKAIHSGPLRLRKLKYLAGKRTKETTHLENGVRIRLNLEETYFSSRLASERLRIAKQVRKGENVLVMFSGVAPYPLVIAKNSLARSIYGVELNLLAHRFALANIPLNKMEKRVLIIKGDVRRVLPKLRKRFDRIVMPLPRTGQEFLSLALGRAKKGAVIHLYAFLCAAELKKEMKKIKEVSDGKVKLLRKVQCGQFSPAISRYCFDLKKVK